MKNSLSAKTKSLLAMSALLAASAICTQNVLSQQYKNLKDYKDALLKAQDACQKNLTNVQASEQATKDRLVRLQNTEGRLQRRLDEIARQLKNVDCARTDLHR
jgi:hypothetical protein